MTMPRSNGFQWCNVWWENASPSDSGNVKWSVTGWIYSNDDGNTRREFLAFSLSDSSNAAMTRQKKLTSNWRSLLFLPWGYFQEMISHRCWWSSLQGAIQAQSGKPDRFRSVSVIRCHLSHPLWPFEIATKSKPWASLGSKSQVAGMLGIFTFALLQCKEGPFWVNSTWPEVTENDHEIVRYATRLCDCD